MKSFQCLFLFFILTTSVFSQNFDNLVTTKQVDCSDISYNTGLYFIKYINENKIDSAKSLLQYWESKCGMREPIFRAKLLLALKVDEFNDSLLNTNGAIHNIFNYQDRMDMIKYSNYYYYDNRKSYFGYIPPGQEFDKYTIDLALHLKNKYNPESIEYLLSEFYSDYSDTILLKIQTRPYEKTGLRKEYDEVVKSYINMPESHMSWITGIWIPTGDLSIVGSHPEIGFQFGTKYKKMNYDLVMTFQFINSPNYYYAKRNKSDDFKELTNYFFGGHIGFDAGRDIYVNKGHEIQLTGGIAYAGFDVFEGDKKNNIESSSAWTYNFNLGLGYRYYITNSFYLGLRAKYNIVDYSLNHVVDLKGNPLTIQFTIGTVNNVFRNLNLKALKYKLRK